MKPLTDAQAAIKAETISLFFALKTGNALGLRELLQSGLDVNSADCSMCTPLHWSAFLNNLEASRVLLDNGADVNSQTLSKRTPLHEACSEGCLELVQLLVDRGAQVNARDYSNRLPLHLACVNNNLAVVKYILTAGSRLDVETAPMKITPLLEALTFGRTNIAKVLVKAGSDVTATDKAGNDALIFYLRCRPLDSFELLPLLVEAGCNFTNKHVLLTKEVFSNEYEVLSWIDEEMAGPRSLRRQTRSAIRKALSISCNNIDIIPGVVQLPLPKALVRYLLFNL